ncbi:MAG: replication protein RepA [Gammaproteobacteria bacterium]|nr:replication protein RepA [Gammaproteobacteria bacterium]
MPRKQRDVEKLVQEALAMEVEEAHRAGVSGYMARVLLQSTIPHSRINGTHFRRTNGLVTVSIADVSGVGLPYGSYPRLLLAWIATEAVKTGDPLLEFGPTLSGFMAELGLLSTGGRWGTIHRLKEQMVRLFSASISCRYAGEDADLGAQLLVAKDYKLWWDPKRPDQAALWGSTVRLSTDLFEELIKHPTLVPMRALKVLKQSPLSLDICVWLTYRYSYLTREIHIPWQMLQLQFGAGYPNTPDGLRDFKKRFRQAAERVKAVFPTARFEAGRSVFTLQPSSSPIHHAA